MPRCELRHALPRPARIRLRNRRCSSRRSGTDTEQVSLRTSTGRRAQDAVLACLGAAWSAFLLPPVVVAWDGAGAPDWAHQFAEAAPYEWVRSAAVIAESPGDYETFGVLVAPALLLIGSGTSAPSAGRRPLDRPAGLVDAARRTGGAELRGPRSTRALAQDVGLGDPTPHCHGDLWRRRGSGRLSVPPAAAVVGGATHRHHRILVGSTVLFTYFPHGSLIGYGLEVAVLALAEPRIRSAGMSSTEATPGRANAKLPPT